MVEVSDVPRWIWLDRCPVSFALVLVPAIIISNGRVRDKHWSSAMWYPSFRHPAIEEIRCLR